LSIEDYVTVSPVFPTATKPGYGPALGAAGAAALAGTVPWLPLGGVDSPDRARECAAAGAAGVAVLGAVMRADDPAAVAASLVAAFGRQPVEAS
jgi:thiamine-phosphate pyrophosphorylase